MITVDNLTKSFGNHTLFDGTGFKLNPREKLGLVGRNGHGKTTLFKIIAGQEHPDSGTLTIPRSYRIGYVRQKLDFRRNTVLQEGMTGLLEPEKDHYWKIEKILAGLGFSSSDMNRHPSDFSGGYQVRLNLAKVLINEPDLLLLDEPTNYLDIHAIRWIEHYLSTWPHEVMLITHDRSFMDKVATHIIGIHRKKLRKIKGNTEKYYSQIARDEEIYEKTRIKDERRRREIEQFIRRFRAKARLASLVQSRIKLLANMSRHEKLDKIKSLDFTFHGLPFAGKELVNVHNISFGYDGRHPVIKDFNLTVNRGDRICVVGQNGQGKTTLLKLLAGVLQPQQGYIKYNSKTSTGFYEQTHIKSLSDEKTVEEEILCSNPSIDKQVARNICGAMMFAGDDALKKISILSGGEKSRVMLGKILAAPVNLLLLDEPTNHLDMESCDALLAALDCFDGTFVMVTHNEMFLHALANRLVVFQNRSYAVSVYEGGYQYFLDKGGWHEEPLGLDSSGKERADGLAKINKKEIRRRRSEIITEKSKVLKPLQRQITAIESEIDRWDKALAKLNRDMQTAAEIQDSQKIAEISQAIHNSQTSIDRLFKELESVTHAYDEKKEGFEKMLQQLNSNPTHDPTSS